MATYALIIVGAGNLGLWTAHALARRGFGRIAVCERAWAGSGATTRSAGVVRQQGGSETAIKLGIWSRALYVELGAELGLDSGFTETGYYILAETEAEKAAFLDLVALRRACGMENEWVDAAEGRTRFPGLDWENLRGATYTANDGYVHPPIVARNITFAAARYPMIDVFERCTVEGIEQRGSTFMVRTTRGTFASDRVLDAGGPRGARAIGAMVGVEVPVAAARHLVVTYPDIPPFPMFFALAKGIYVRPEEQGALLGLSNPSEQADYSDRYQLDFDWDYFERMRPAWESVFPALAGQRVSRSWAGSIDYTPDHLPIIDQPLEGFYVLAAGGHGMMWGPALGTKMAELIADGAVRDLPAKEIELDRFRAGYVHHDAIALPFPTT